MLKWLPQIVAAAALTFIATRVHDVRRASRDYGGELVSEIRDRVTDVIEAAVDYWAGGIDGADKAKLESRIRLLEADLREGMTLLRDELPETGANSLNEYALELIAELTGGEFEGKQPAGEQNWTDIDRARRIAAVGALVRSEAAKAWRATVRSDRGLRTRKGKAKRIRAVMRAPRAGEE